MLGGWWTDAGQMLDGCWADAGRMPDGRAIKLLMALSLSLSLLLSLLPCYVLLLMLQLPPMLLLPLLLLLPQPLLLLRLLRCISSVHTLRLGAPWTPCGISGSPVTGSMAESRQCAHAPRIPSMSSSSSSPSSRSCDLKRCCSISWSLVIFYFLYTGETCTLMHYTTHLHGNFTVGMSAGPSVDGTTRCNTYRRFYA